MELKAWREASTGGGGLLSGRGTGVSKAPFAGYFYCAAAESYFLQ